MYTQWPRGNAVSNIAMASDDLHIVSVEEVQCLCLDRRSVGKRKETERASGSGRKTPTNVTGSNRKGKHRQKLSAVDSSDTSSIVVIDDWNDVHVDGMSHSSSVTSSCCGPLKPVHLNSDSTDDVIVISGMSEQAPEAHKREDSLAGKLMAGLKDTSTLSLSEAAQHAQQEAVDIALARQLQHEENSKLVVVSPPPTTSPPSSSSSSSSTAIASTSSSSTVTTLPTTSSSKTRRKSHRDAHVEVKIVSSSRVVVQDKVQLPPPKKLKDESSSHLELPVYWTKCANHKGGDERYSLVDVDSKSQEWFNVCGPMICANFTVTRLQRIQNPSLWERLQSERQLMVRNHPKSFDVNERLLYHTSRSDTKVICEEGLDQRLSRSGRFGRGIYFR